MKKVISLLAIRLLMEAKTKLFLKATLQKRQMLEVRKKLTKILQSEV